MFTNFCCEDFYLYSKQLESRFPFVTLSVIGKTVLKRDIYALSIGTGEKSVLFLGGMSGTDALTPAILLRFFERLCISMKNDLKISAVKTSNILREQKIIVIPMVNPDGLEISLHGADCAKNFTGLVRAAQKEKPDMPWRANARGVEPHMNFDYCFPTVCTHCKPSPTGNFGPKAESEAETQAITNFVRNNNIKYSVLLSAEGEKIVYSAQKSTSEVAMMSQIFKSISGFPAESRNKKACSGNFCEWFTKSFGRPSFEFSFDGTMTLSAESFESFYLSNEELIMLSAIM